MVTSKSEEAVLLALYQRRDRLEATSSISKLRADFGDRMIDVTFTYMRKVCGPEITFTPQVAESIFTRFWRRNVHRDLKRVRDREGAFEECDQIVDTKAHAAFDEVVHHACIATCREALISHGARPVLIDAFLMKALGHAVDDIRHFLLAVHGVQVAQTTLRVWALRHFPGFEQQLRVHLRAIGWCKQPEASETEN